MLQLILMRHAKSSWDHPGMVDFDRPLNKRGEHDGRTVARYLRQHDVKPAQILCSAAQRTRQTLDLIISAVQPSQISFLRQLYETSANAMLDILRQQPDDSRVLMLIGHNPGLEELTCALTDGHGDPTAVNRLLEKFPTGTLAFISLAVESWSQVDLGCGFLTRMVRPRDLETT